MYRTTIILGSSYHEHYVNEDAYKILKDFCSLPPAEVTSSPSSFLEFEVPGCHTSVLQTNKTSTSHYSVMTDTKCTRIKTTLCRLVGQPILYQKKAEKLQLQVLREDFKEDAFLLKEEAKYSHSKYIDESINCRVIGWNRHWDIQFQKLWVTPYHSEEEKGFIIFNGRPVYSVKICVDGFPDLETIQSFIKVAFPKTFAGPYERLHYDDANSNSHSF